MRSCPLSAKGPVSATVLRSEEGWFRIVEMLAPMDPAENSRFKRPTVAAAAGNILSMGSRLPDRRLRYLVQYLYAFGYRIPNRLIRSIFPPSYSDGISTLYSRMSRPFLTALEKWIVRSAGSRYRP